jgi:hypothetical protein
MCLWSQARNDFAHSLPLALVHISKIVTQGYIYFDSRNVGLWSTAKSHFCTHQRDFLELWHYVSRNVLTESNMHLCLLSEWQSKSVCVYLFAGASLLNEKRRIDLLNLDVECIFVQHIAKMLTYF